MITDEQLVDDAKRLTRIFSRQFQVNRDHESDLLSEVYLSLHQARERFNPELASWKWYSGLRAKSAVIEFLRKQIPYQQRNSFIIDIDETEDDYAFQIGTEDDLTYTELKDLLKDLKPKYREVALCLVSGMTNREIGQRLNLSEFRIGEMVVDLRRGLAHENLR